jgi:hypothetical protein
MKVKILDEKANGWYNPTFGWRKTVKPAGLSRRSIT